MNHTFGQATEDNVCIYYFPQTQNFTTNIWLKYVNVENIATREEYMKKDTDINTIVQGGLWYKIYISKTFLKQGISLEKIQLLVAEFNDESTRNTHDDSCMIVQYHKHKMEVKTYNYSNFTEETKKKLVSDELLLIEQIKSNFFM